MKLTKALKEHAAKNFGVAADASDDVYRDVIGKKIADGTFDVDTLQSLTKSTNAEAKVGEMIDEKLAKSLAPLTEAMTAITKALGGKIGGDGGAVDTKAGAGAGGAASKAFGAASERNLGEFDGNPADVDVKSVVERYTHDPRAATYLDSSNMFLKSAYGARPVYSADEAHGGYAIDMPTKRTKAIAGTWFKHLIGRAFRQKGMPVPGQFALNEQDRMMLKYIANECQFVGSIQTNPNQETYLTGEKLYNDLWKKAVLDDSTSGGLEAVPIEFDAAVILTPILNGELFPLVDVRNVNRRRIEATVVGNPTVSWGGASGTSISLFDTDAFISAFDNNLHVIDGAMELGRDFLSDSPLDIAGIVQNRYGEKFRQALDNVIATGDGINQPEGLFTASGVATVTPAGGAGAAPQVGDYEGLMHGIAKEYQQEAGIGANSRMVFIGTQTSYQRARSIPVDSSNDARRIFGQDNQLDYRLMGLRYAINASLTNAQLGCFCMNRYRMYRRLGFTVEIAMNDAQSIRRNTQTIVVRGRFGGSLEKAAAGTKITNSQA